MVDEKLQFAISQYVDGSLAPAEAAQLEVRFASDAESRRLVDEYRRLDQWVKAAMPEPEMDWEAMARQISAAVAASETQAPMSIVASAPASWWRPMALAASILIFATFAAMAWQTMARRSGQPGESLVLQPSPPQGYALVSVFRIVEPVSSGVVQVGIQQRSPNGSSMLAGIADAYPELTSAAQAKVLIAAVPMALSDEDSIFLR